MIKMNKKRGRPKKFNSRTKKVISRMTTEEKFHFKRICEKEGLSESEGIRMAAKALRYLSENNMIYCITKNQDEGNLNYCSTENQDEDDEDLYH